MNNAFDGLHYSVDEECPTESLLKWLPEEEQRVFVTSSDIAPKWHVLHQARFQQYVDAGVSKTINLSNGATKEDIAYIYKFAWEEGCKGITVYREGSREKEVIVAAGKAPTILPKVTGTIDLVIKEVEVEKRKRPPRNEWYYP